MREQMLQHQVRTVERIDERLPMVTQQHDRSDMCPGFAIIHGIQDSSPPVSLAGFCLGTLLCAMEYYGQALEYLECSIEAYGPNPQRLYNVALCCYRLRDWDRARDAVGQALEIAPDFSKARDLSIAIEGARESTQTAYAGTVLP